MARRHFLFTYDISDDKRRTRVFKTLRDQGDHAQFSVFFCELNEREFQSLKGELSQIINSREDQILILDLGGTHNPLDSGLEALGRPYRPGERVLVI